jgi:type IV pilus assembly protein PilE
MINLSRKKGFTLIELLIALVIASVLVALALPSFKDTLRKSRRSDAMELISRIHLAQERWRINHPGYADLGDLGLSNPLVSPDGHYQLTITANGATNYTLVASPVAGDDQANDACGAFTLTFTAGVITKTTSSGVATQCWRK